MRKILHKKGINIVDFVWKTLDINEESRNFDSLKKKYPI